MSHTYRVETPSGKAVRRTNRVYTHIVVPADDQRLLIETRYLQAILVIKAELAKTERKLASGEKLGWDGLPAFLAKHYPTRPAEQVAAEIEQDEVEHRRRTERDVVSYQNSLSPAGLKLLRARITRRHTGVYIGWCGRYDLAVKLQRSKGGIILEVPQPVK